MKIKILEVHMAGKSEKLVAGHANELHPWMLNIIQLWFLVCVSASFS